MSLVFLKKHILLLGVVTFVILTSAMLFSLRVVDAVVELWGLVIIWAGIAPLLVHVFRPGQEATPFFPAVGIFYVVFFGLPVFTILLAWPDSRSILLYSRLSLGEIQPQLIALAATGIAAMVAAFYACRPLVRRLPVFRLPVFVESVDLAWLYTFLLLGHQLERIFPGWTGIPSAIQFFEPVGYVAFGGFYLLWRRGRLSRQWLIFAFGLCLPIEIYLRVRLLYLTDILFMLMFAALLLWRERQYTIVMVVTTVVVLILSIYGVSSVVRYTKPEGFERLSLAARAYVTQFIGGQVSLDTRGEETGDGQAYEFWGRFGSLVMRTSHIWIFHVVGTKSPDPVPYWGGASYQPLLTSFVPRALYPDKPEERFGLEFGRRYALLEPDQDGTSINIPWLTELLANFGPLGVVLGMFFIGLVLAALDRIFNTRDMSDPAFAIGLTIIFPLAYPESNLSVVIGSMIPLFVSLWVFFAGGAWILWRRSKQLSATSG